MQVEAAAYKNTIAENVYDTIGKTKKSSVLFHYSYFAALLFGIKLWLIHVYGNATPFWDQWDAEATKLYKPFIDGSLGLRQLLAAHNEHRIFTTRLLALELLNVNKIWNPLLQMVVNAGLHIFTILVSISLIARVTGRKHLPALLAFSLVLFSIPYGWENTLEGFQSQFYFLLLFSVTSIWLLTTKLPFTGRWWGGILCGTLAFLSMASGIFVFAAGAIISLLFCLLRLRYTSRQLFASILLAGLFVLGILWTPTIQGHASLKAASLGQFYHAFITLLGWPISSSFFSAFIRNLPILIFIIVFFRKLPPATDIRWFLFALIVWLFSQNASIAYGRAVQTLSSRYRDLHTFSILVDFACLISIAEIYTNKWKRYTIIGLNVWIAILLISMTSYGFKYLPDELTSKREISIVEEKNTRDYIASGDISHLKNKPFLHIPYPEPEGLVSIIELPGIKEILPTNISRPLRFTAIEKKPEEAFIVNGYYFTTPKRPDSTWGSYTVQGDGAMGQMSLQFNTNLTGTKIEIPVSGYPLNKGMKLEIEQNDQRNALNIKNNPGEAWGVASARIIARNFSIHAVDSSTVSQGWLAIGTPMVIGKYDGMTARILSNYYVFILIGIVVIIFLITQAGFFW